MRGTMPAMSDDGLDEAWRRGREARPDIALDRDRYRAYVEARGATPADCLDDLYLACACVDGVPAAIRAFEREYVPILDAALASWNRAEETRARVVAMLLVDHAGAGPLLAKYSGRGALRRWIRVVAVREAGKDRRADRDVPVDDERLFDAIVPAGDPQLSAVKRDAAAAFRIAFDAALAQLDRRERAVLRLHLLDGLSIDEIAPIYDAHRATVARWIAAARRDVLERTRRGLMHDLRIGPDDVDSLIRLVQSRIEVPADALASGDE
jgi:RNA polymerase sigma-70 factor (ECF subfamily)